MNYEVVFDLSHISKIPYFSAAGVFAGLFIVAISIFASCVGRTAHTPLWSPIIALVFSLVFLYFSIQLTLSTSKMIHTIYGSYEAGEVQIVEGQVQECDTAYFYKNGRGSFTVDGVQFDYGHTSGLPGYRGKDNLIHSNGQQVRIYYIPYSNENLIVKIEALK